MTEPMTPPESDTPQRILLDSDAYCPKCGHNRDTSAVSSIVKRDGMHACQMCDATWSELALADRVRMAIGVCKLTEDEESAADAECELAALRAVLRKAAMTCSGHNFDDDLGYCGKAARYTVEWSDRGPCPVCAEHLEQGKSWAANDGEGDRTDTPFVRDVYSDELCAAIDSALRAEPGAQGG